MTASVSEPILASTQRSLPSKHREACTFHSYMLQYPSYHCYIPVCPLYLLYVSTCTSNDTHKHTPSNTHKHTNTAAGVLSCLEEQDTAIKVKALHKLHSIVDVHWAEVCDGLTAIEELSEDPSFPAADLAAAVASKCFYHLQSYGDSLKLALSAGKYLDILVKSEYSDMLIATCIDEYKSMRLAGSDTEATIDPRMEKIVEQMFQRCYKDGCFEQAVGIALGKCPLLALSCCVCHSFLLTYSVLAHVRVTRDSC